MFLGYDLLARRWVCYESLHPWLELLAGVLMIAGALPWLSIPVALGIGAIGAISVFMVVYIDKRELKCACVGGSGNEPLGFVSLTENLMMARMAVWMPSQLLITSGEPVMYWIDKTMLRQSRRRERKRFLWVRWRVTMAVLVALWRAWAAVR